MGGYAEEYLPILKRLPHQRKLVVLKIAQAAMDQAGGPLRRSAGDVLLVEQQHLKAAHRSIPGDTGAVDARPNDDNIEGVATYVPRNAALRAALHLRSLSCCSGPIRA